MNLLLNRENERKREREATSDEYKPLQPCPRAKGHLNPKFATTLQFKQNTQLIDQRIQEIVLNSNNHLYELVCWTPRY